MSTDFDPFNVFGHDYDWKEEEWKYLSNSGKLVSPSGSILGTGYSGKDEHKNIPYSESIHDLGPIPRGLYTIGPAHDTSTHGLLVLGLVPAKTNEMYGRSGFLIHGDSLEHPGEASNGCIVLNHALRETIAKSGVKRLRVL